MQWSAWNILRKYRRTAARGFIVVVSSAIIFLIVTIGNANTGDESKLVPVASELQALLADANAENEKRIAAVKDTCARYNLGMYRGYESEAQFKHPPAPQYSVFYIVKAHNLSYCPVYKAGSSTWIYNLCLLMGLHEQELTNSKEQLSTIARRVLPELEYPEAEEALRTTKKLLVVRHPFERLLSAYRDKLENSVARRESGTLHFYRKYGATIVRKYRDENIPSPRPDQVIKREGIPGPAGTEPTWREFVQYLIQTDLASYGDDHWMPYYLFCTPCSLNYDFVAKVETLWRDQIFAIHKLGLQDKIVPRWRHSGGQSTASKIYFSQLTPELVQKLYDKFKLDFELFGYSPKNYYQYATSNA